MNIGFALTGSFCTIKKVLKIIEEITKEHNVFPICSNNVATLNTRFISAKETLNTLEGICKNPVMTTVTTAEVIGPKKMLDVLVVAPCSGNTLAKVANGITDGAVTMAIKAQLRNKRPVVFGISTNDGLSTGIYNISRLLNKKNVYFIPFGQDDCINKETSLVSDFSKTMETTLMALKGEQIQPILINHKK